MDPFLKMDVFFFIAAVSTVALSLVLSLVLYRLWIFIGTLQKIADEVHGEAEVIRADMAKIREVVLSEGNKLLGGMSSIHTMVNGFFGRKKSRSKKVSEE